MRHDFTTEKQEWDADEALTLDEILQAGAEARRRWREEHPDVNGYLVAHIGPHRPGARRRGFELMGDYGAKLTLVLDLPDDLMQYAKWSPWEPSLGDQETLIWLLGGIFSLEEERLRGDPIDLDEARAIRR